MILANPAHFATYVHMHRPIYINYLPICRCQRFLITCLADIHFSCSLSTVYLTGQRLAVCCEYLQSCICDVSKRGVLPGFPAFEHNECVKVAMPLRNAGIIIQSNEWVWCILAERAVKGKPCPDSSTSLILAKF